MSSLTYAQARDEILVLLKTAWDAGAGTAAMLYPDLAQEPPKAGSWARASVNHVAGQQGSLAGASGLVRYERRGVVVVQIFTEAGTGLSSADALATIVSDAFEGQTTPGAVWFRNVRINEIGPDGQWYQLNVLAEFLYDQYK